MNNEEANRVIAEYMGIEFDIMPCGQSACTIPLGGNKSRLIYNYFTTSLDSLVSVWEKLKFVPMFGCMYKPNGGTRWECCRSEWFSTIQEAAAHATAKAILEINKTEKQ